MRAVDTDTGVHMQEFSDNVFTKHVACAALRKGEALNFRLWVRPHEVRKGTFVGNLLHARDLAVDFADVLEGR